MDKAQIREMIQEAIAAERSRIGDIISDVQLYSSFGMKRDVRFILDELADKIDPARPPTRYTGSTGPR